MGGPTLFDVAKKAGVSKSTVSLVINGSSRVNKDTADRVWRAIRELNYVPNRTARALQSGRSFLIGIIVSDITNPYFAELVRSVILTAKAEGYDVFAFDTDYDITQLQIHLQHLRGYRPDGLLIFTTEREQAIVEHLDQLCLPTILLNWGMSGRWVGDLVVDYEPGIDALLEHLLTLGHRRLAFVVGPSSYHSAAARAQAFRRAVTARQPYLEPPLFITSDFRLHADVGIQLLKVLKTLPPSQCPTAIVASNDLMAISILRALHSEGYKIPDEISLAGIDDISLTEYVTPSLTTLRLPRRRMGELSFQMLHRLIHGEKPEDILMTVSPRLIIRESTALAPATRLEQQ